MTGENAVEKKKTGLTSFALHILAMTFMLCDHVWATLPTQGSFLTCIGRLAYPIFAFLLAEGFVHTHSWKEYALRLLGMAAVTELPFDLMYGGTLFYPFHQNVLWTLLLSLLCLWGIDAVRQKGRLWLTVFAVLGISLAGLLLGTVLMLDYYGTGVLTVIIFYLFRGQKWWQRLGQLAGLFWINCILLGGQLLPVTLFGLYLELPQQGLALLSLVFLWAYRGEQGHHSRAFQAFCYGFYPAHMLILAGLSRLIS